MDIKRAFLIAVSLVVVFKIHDYVDHQTHHHTPVVIVSEQTVPVAVIAEEPRPALPEIDVEQMHCLAKNIYFEARGESTEGKVAVANVVLNRVDHWHYPETVCGVVYQAKLSQWWLEHNGREVPVRNMCQFSWYCDGKSDDLQLTDEFGRVIKANMESWTESIEIARLALLGQLTDLTHGATHYYNPNLAQPMWAVHYEETATIDNHCFHKM